MATVLALSPGAFRRSVTTPLTADHLDSWKAVAAFFCRTIRTVQRWELSENLPVYRHVHEKLGSVYAFESELIAWRDARSRQQRDTPRRKNAPARRFRLAVLPFTNLSSDPEFRNFEDGLTYEIIAQLACLNPARLGVIARTSVMPYKESGYTIAQIGQRLRVDFILEGSVRIALRRARIAAQLISVADQTHLFAHTAAGRRTHAVAMQITFSQQIARMLSQYLLRVSSFSRALPPPQIGQSGS